MPFEPGQSGNPNGRPQGAANKVNAKVRGYINTLLENNFEAVQTAFLAMEGRDKVRAWIDMLPFVVPKMQSMSAQIDWEKLSDEDLDEIIERLKAGNGK